MNWLCVQDGAREHYAIPRALHRSGRLEALFTGFWAGPVVRGAARWIPAGGLRSLAGRHHPDLEEGRWKPQQKAETLKPEILKAEVSGRKVEIVSWNWQVMGRELGAKSESGKRKAESGNCYERFIREGRWFSERVRDHLARRGTDVRGRVVFSYDTTALELFRWAKERGAFCVLGQMDPGRVEAEMVRDEEKRWPGWARKENAEMLKAEREKEKSRKQKAESGKRKAEIGDAYFRRREEEWRLADRIMVNSQWSFDALVKQGVSPEKLVVVPLCFEEKQKAEKLKSESRKQKSQNGDEFQLSTFQISAFPQLRVLFLGQVVLRKGIQYLLETAKLLRNEPVHFDVVGPAGISDDAIKSAPANMVFHGRVNRDEAAGWYERADVFALPTLSDGFAITQIEAMAHGLPVIATPHCGEVVTDGVDGFIVPARDATMLAEAIRRYLKEPELLRSQRDAALAKSKQFTLDKLAERLVILEQNLKAESRKRTAG